ncbi:oxidoreductase [Patulibacter defluvii]|uniref:oxidoreductase n=1 Tax=Patulibacter defluvii TaxID=3095358 RepID=UPI002A74B54A|nr:FAD-dependent oxidoreductase [Patulibacter sp. DM4]
MQVGPVTLRNRIAAGPSTLLYAEDNVLSERHVAFHAERARGGAGLILTEEHGAYRTALGAFPDACTAWDPRAVPALARLAEAVHEHGAAAFVQLYGPGIADTGTVVGDAWQPVVGPSRVPSPGPGAVPYALGDDDIAEIVAGHATSARNVAEAGLDGVEVHAAHGWLAAQFLSPLFNRRSDRYGGSARRRCRFVLELLEAIRAAADGLAVGVQLSVDEYVGAAGITPEECLIQVDELVGSGLVDYVNVSTGSPFSIPRTIAAMEAPAAVLADHGRAIREAVAGRAAVLLVDTIRTVDDAAAVVAAGAADVAVMTRAHFADPFLVRKAMAGRTDETVPCIGENECMVRAFGARPVACLMNPAMGREARWGEQATAAAPTPVPRRIAIAGAGPAGLRAAATLADRGHEVVVWERGPLGGHLDPLSRLPGRRRWRLAIDAFARAAERAGVELRQGEAATAAGLAAHAPDLVLCATGASWDRSGLWAGTPAAAPLPGIDAPHVLDVAEALRRALDDPTALGARVAIVDATGEYLPLGLADLLSAAGVRVELVTPQAEVGRWVRQAQDGTEVFARLAERGVAVTAGRALAAVAGDAVALEETWSGRRATLEGVDAVVLSLLRTPDDRLLRELETAGVAARPLGDALAPRRTIEVVYEAEAVARELV